MDFKVRVGARYLPVDAGFKHQTGQHCDAEEHGESRNICSRQWTVPMDDLVKT